MKYNLPGPLDGIHNLVAIGPDRLGQSQRRLVHALDSRERPRLQRSLHAVQNLVSLRVRSMLDRELGWISRRRGFAKLRSSGRDRVRIVGRWRVYRTRWLAAYRPVRRFRFGHVFHRKAPLRFEIAE